MIELKDNFKEKCVTQNTTTVSLFLTVKCIIIKFYNHLQVIRDDWFSFLSIFLTMGWF